MKTMKKLMALAIMSVCGLSARAAVIPAAVWDGDFKTTTKSGYTLDKKQHTVAEDGSSIQIGSGTNGIEINWETGISAATVIFKCEDVPTQVVAGKNSCYASIRNTSSVNRVGVVRRPADGKMQGIWANTLWADSPTTDFPVSEGKQVYALGYQYNAGTMFCAKVEDEWSILLNASGLGSPAHDANTINGVSVLGYRGSSGNMRTLEGAKVTAIAIFTSKLTADEIAAYKFPSEQEYKTAKATISEDMDWSAIDFDPAIVSPTQDVELTIEGEEGKTIKVALDDVVEINNLMVLGSSAAHFVNVENLTCATLSYGNRAFTFEDGLGADDDPPTYNIEGVGVFTKIGEGTIAVDFGQSHNSEIVVEGGTLKAKEGSKYAFGTSAPITIKEGATVDYNGMIGEVQPTVKLLGGTLKNSRQNIGTTSKMINTIEVGAVESIIDAEFDFGIVAGGYGASALKLSEDAELPASLIKKGAGKFYLINTTASGYGTFDIAEGSLNIAANSSGVTMNEGVTLKLSAGTLTMNNVLSLYNLDCGEGTIEGNGLLVVNGYLTPVAEHLPINLYMSKTASVVFPEGTQEGDSIPLCTGDFDVEEATIAGKTIYVGAEEIENVNLIYDVEEKCVSYIIPTYQDDFDGDTLTIKDVNDIFDPQLDSENEVQLTLTSEDDPVVVEIGKDDEFNQYITIVHIVRNGDVRVNPVNGIEQDEFATLLAKFDFSGVTGEVIDGRGFYDTDGDVTISELNKATLGYEWPVTVTFKGAGNKLTIDATPNFEAIILAKDGDIVISKDEAFSGNIDAIIGAMDYSAVTGSVTWDGISRTTLATRLGGATYTVGVGTEDAPVPFTLNVENGAMTLKDGEFYLNTTFSATTSTVNFENAKIHAIAVSGPGSGGLGVGQATFNVGGTSEITTEKLILSQGGAGRTASLKLSDSAVINVTGETNADSNESSIMFGHWNGPSTFTIEGDAVFNAPKADILIGKTHNNHTINLNGGTTTVHGIKLASSADGRNSLILNDGTLNIGAGGITTYSTNCSLVIWLSSSFNIGVLDSCAISQGIMIAAGGESTLTIDVAEEKVVMLTSEFEVYDDETPTLKKTGEGELDIYSELAGFMEGGKIVIEGGKVVTPAGNEGTVEVTSGALYLALSMEKAVDGYVAEGVTLPEGEKVFFIKPDGSIVEGTGDKGNVYEGTGIVWTGNGASAAWSDGDNWEGNVAPSEGDYATFPEGVTTEVLFDEGDTCEEILVRGDVTFNLGEGAVIDPRIVAVAETGSASYTGVGTIVCDGVKPTLALTEGWTGSVWLKNQTFNDWGTFEEYGNASSKVKLTGISGYAKKEMNVRSIPEIVLEDEGEGDAKVYALTVNNGYSRDASYIFGKVSGTGTFRFHREDDAKPTQTYIFENVEDFEGKIGDVGGIKAVIGEGTGTGYTASAINYLNGAKVTAGLGWTATKATFGETLTVVGDEGDVVVTVTEEPTTAMPAVTLDGKGEGWTLEYDAETGNIKVVKSGEVKMGTMMYLR